jgi:hypothetical protein
VTLTAKAGDKLASAGKEALQQAGLKLEQVAEARKEALQRVQKDLLAGKQSGKAGCVQCTKGEKPVERELHMPTGRSGNGKWNTPDGAQPSDGNGTFVFNEEKVLPEKVTLPNGKTVDKVQQIEFKNGAPDFDPYVKGEKHDLWVVTGKAKTDADELGRMMREKNPKWEAPDDTQFVLHHFEDGKVGYVPRVLHDKNKGFSGVAHTGGNSMINNDTF